MSIPLPGVGGGASGNSDTLSPSLARRMQVYARPRRSREFAIFATLRGMRIHVLATPELAAERAADWLRTEIGRACAQRGPRLLPLSGGRPPWAILRARGHDLLAVQVDERVVPENDDARNARRHPDLLIGAAMLRAALFHAMPV